MTKSIDQSTPAVHVPDVQTLAQCARWLLAEHAAGSVLQASVSVDLTWIASRLNLAESKIHLPQSKLHLAQRYDIELLDATEDQISAATSMILRLGSGDHALYSQLYITDRHSYQPSAWEMQPHTTLQQIRITRPATTGDAAILLLAAPPISAASR